MISMRYFGKIWLLLIIGVVFIMSCHTNRPIAKSGDAAVFNNDAKVDTIRIANEELEYELIILDVGFESWLITQRPISYYNNETLRFKNYQYVVEWNIRATTPGRYDSSLYEVVINYDPSIDYGKELNYKLYQYFQFFQQKYNQRLL